MNKLFKLIILIFVSFNSFSSNSSIASGVSTDRDFGFIAEIPAYVSFVSSSMEEVFKQERAYADTKKPLLEDPFSLETECFIDFAKDNTRGSIKVYERDKHLSARHSIPSYEENSKSLNALVTLFQDEAFGTSAGTSREEFDKSMVMVIFANRMKSVFAIKNQSLKYDFMMGSNIIVLRGAWEPVWKFRQKSGQKAREVPLKFIRSYMRKCLRNAQNLELNEPERKLWLVKAETLYNQEMQVNGHVPYHELREYLRTHSLRNKLVIDFFTTNPCRQLYEATHDNDLVALRTVTDGGQLPAVGLYTYYSLLLNDFKHAHLAYPHVLTTGYRAAYESRRFATVNDFAWLYQSVEEDRYARAESSRIDFRVSYIAEPNCLYLIPAGQLAISNTFLSLPNGENLSLNDHNNYDPCESMSIMTQIYAGTKGAAKVCFDPKHPALMRVPDRMLSNKKSKTAFRLDEIGVYDMEKDRFEVRDFVQALKFSSSISQTPFAYLDYASTLYRQFGLVGIKAFCDTQKVFKPDSLFKSLIPTLFNHFDLATFVLTDSNILVPQSKLNITYTNRRSADDLENGQIVRRLNAIAALESINDQLSSVIQLINEIYGHKCPGIGDILLSTAKAMGLVRQTHYSEFFVFSTETRRTRTHPRQSIEQSPLNLVPPQTVIVLKMEAANDISLEAQKSTNVIRLKIEKPIEEELAVISREYSKANLADLIKRIYAGEITVNGEQLKTHKKIADYALQILPKGSHFGSLKGDTAISDAKREKIGEVAARELWTIFSQFS